MFPNDDKFESMFTLESEKDGEIEEKPFKILVLGDWSGDAEKQTLAERVITEIDRDNFNSVLNRLRPKLQLELFENSVESLELEFTELDDFHPDNIFRRISLFDELRSLRRRLSDPNTFNNAAREVRKWISESDFKSVEQVSIQPKTVQSDELLDRILSGKTETVKLQDANSIELSNLLKDLVRPFLIDFDENEQKSLISLVDNATSGLMRKIIHQPKFQTLEAAWRSLYFLVRNTETDSSLKIYILNITKEELSAKLKAHNDLTETEVFRKIVYEANTSLNGESWSVLIGNYEFYSEIDDVAALIRLSKIAGSILSPFISKMSPTLLGVDSFANESFNPDFSDESVQGKLWAKLRSFPESEFLGLTVNRFLLRLPFGSATDEIERFHFEEFDGKPIHNKYLWGNSSFVCALLLARSFSKYQWEMGNHLEQDVENLPFHIYSDETEKMLKPCAEIIFSQSIYDRLMDFGLMPLISYRNTDRVKLARFQSIIHPVSTLIGKWNV